MSHSSPRASRPRQARLRGVIALFAVLVASMVASTLAASPASALFLRPKTVVSLTFDDANAEQVTAAATMQRYGMSGTFFVNSGFIDTPGHLTSANLNALKSAGHEIGGHSISHPDLQSIPADEIRRQVCDDRARLTARGFTVRSFAYPFASSNTEAEAIVQECGYNSARGLGDLGIPGDGECAGCPYAAELPPESLFYTAALPQVESSWTLSDLKGTVTRAERTGGWVQLTFHHVCDASAACELNVTPTVLNQFTRWLWARKILRNTVVQTVGDTVGGAAEPVVTGPVPIPASPGANGVVNPGMESLNADGTAQCWMKGGYGTNTAVLDLASPGRTGQRAGQVAVSGYSDGDAKWLPQFDLGGCSPTVAAGHTYSMRQWYTASGPTQFAIYLRDNAGVWRYWTSSPWFASTDSFTEAAWTTPEIPSGMTGISFGLNVFGNGVLTTDDASLYDTVGAPPTAAEIAATPATAPPLGALVEAPATESEQQ